MPAYYNEIDPFAAAWLRELIRAGLIADGEVDERSVEDVRPGDLRGFQQCHFFAGIGGWSHAFRLAGWPDDREAWTGSCPCQPFSAAGKGAGFADERHLWPSWFHLIRVCRPPVVFGEQVDKALVWLDLVHDDMEAEGYAFGAADIPAAGVGAPHIRQRLWWVAYAQRWATERHGLEVGTAKGRAQGEAQEREWLRDDARDGLAVGNVANTNDTRSQGRGRTVVCERADQRAAGGGGASGGSLADTERPERRSLSEGRLDVFDGADAGREEAAGRSELHRTDGFWSACDWLPCRDGKWRPVESGTFPLAHGIPARVGRLRGYGNAINPHVAAAFVKAAAEI